MKHLFRPACASALMVAAATLMPSLAAGQAMQHDTSLPIEITADQLDVDQNQRLATFTGNVDAVQGDLVLSADRLDVHYRGGGDAAEGDGGGSTPGGSAPGGSGSIRRIEAEGNVFLSSPTETAQGEVGIYDVASNMVTIEGSVVLTRADNVIRGDRLEIDLTSGRSRMIAAASAASGGEPARRVRAIFTPQSAPAPAAGPAAGDASPSPAAK